MPVQLSLNLDAARAQQLGRLADIRWQHEIGGLTLEGMAIRTDRQTRAALTEVVNSLAAGLMTEPVTWKMAAGWADLTEAQLLSITAAVSSHVKASFAAERAVSLLIETSETPLALDLQAEFESALSA